MAKYERVFRGDFDAVVRIVHDGVLAASSSASYEDGSAIEPAGTDVRCAVRVYERYSAFGGNRVAMNVTILGVGPRIFVSAIAAGGSQAVMWKVNTVGEENFLDTLVAVVEPLAQAAPDTAM
ncbi:DUF6054 family protein [Gordonia sp. HY002]|uniref:DUF6054 family protein n=1 Tax=Gordonia zhenghanii TaxID=2911516 RepID=UPI001EEF8A67|nr:DUF6054 family protein [Gordonia zhenghanii]MCF8568859.1 DUF6054 family protein [Gordonia zhenghanii]MCF8602271.1 DUF6054 family protein [Gordonia zhenghanii]